MSLRSQILNDLKEAIKNKDKETLSVVRMIKGAIQLEEIDKKRELNDDEVISVVSKQIKQRKDANVEFEKGDRQDLIDENNNEISILNRYMPEQLDSDEVEKIIDEKIKELNIESIKEMGILMKNLTPILKGKTDMSMVSAIIKDKLN